MGWAMPGSLGRRAGNLITLRTSMIAPTEADAISAATRVSRNCRVVGRLQLGGSEKLSRPRKKGLAFCSKESVYAHARGALKRCGRPSP